MVTLLRRSVPSRAHVLQYAGQLDPHADLPAVVIAGQRPLAGDRLVGGGRAAAPNDDEVGAAAVAPHHSGGRAEVTVAHLRRGAGPTRQHHRRHHLRIGLDGAGARAEPDRLVQVALGLQVPAEAVVQRRLGRSRHQPVVQRGLVSRPGVQRAQRACPDGDHRHQQRRRRQPSPPPQRTQQQAQSVHAVRRAFPVIRPVGKSYQTPWPARGRGRRGMSYRSDVTIHLKHSRSRRYDETMPNLRVQFGQHPTMPT